MGGKLSELVKAESEVVSGDVCKVIEVEGFAAFVPLSGVGSSGFGSGNFPVRKISTICFAESTKASRLSFLTK